MGENYIDIDINWEEVNNKLKIFFKTSYKFHIALNKVLNQTINSVNNKAKEEIFKKYNVMRGNKRAINSGIKKNPSSLNKLEASVETKGRPLSLVKLKHRKNSKHLTAFANPKSASSGGRTGGFVATMASGHKAIWVRTGKFSHETRSKNAITKHRAEKTKKGLEKIRELFGPGTSQMFSNDDITEEVSKEAKEKFKESLSKIIDKAITQALKR